LRLVQSPATKLIVPFTEKENVAWTL
jgi:hypothetical protein